MGPPSRGWSQAAVPGTVMGGTRSNFPQSPPLPRPRVTCHLSSHQCCSLAPSWPLLLRSPYSLPAFQWVTLKPDALRSPLQPPTRLWLLPESPSTACLQGGHFNEPISEPAGKPLPGTYLPSASITGTAPSLLVPPTPHPEPKSRPVQGLQAMAGGAEVVVEADVERS